MRFLHTADWHVGRTLRGRARDDEFSAALDEIVAVARGEDVDAVLLAGDVWDQRAVTPHSDELVFDTLIRLGELARVIVVPGNHDSAARLNALAPLLERVHTTVVPKVLRADAGAVVEVESRDGKETALVACLPFISPRHFSSADALYEDIAAGYVNYDHNMGVLLGAYEKAFRPKSINVVMGHMFLSGSQPGGSEREVTVGTDYAVAPQHLPRTASYIALGHIHKPQRVPGSPAEARYAGSLLQLDFGEKGQEKSVVVVDARAGKPPKATEVPVGTGRRLLDVEGTVDELEQVAAKVGDAYLRVSVKLDGPVPGIADRVRKILPNTLDVRLVFPQRDDEGPRESLRGLDPKQQFASYFEAVHGSEVSDELSAAFDRVYEEVSG